MMTKRILLLIILCFNIHVCFCQVKVDTEKRILFRGLVMDATTLSPVPNSQIVINRVFPFVSDTDGSFVFYVNRNDTVIFSSLGYKPTVFIVSDTLKGNEFNAGIYMNSDTLSIGEVVIISRFRDLKSEILNAASSTPSTFDNAKYNIAISGYQGRNSQGSLGNPADNYALLVQKQKMNAFEKGGIPSDQIVGISPLLLLPAAYLLIKGSPEKTGPFVPKLSDREVDQIQKKYLETQKQRK